MVEVIKKVKAYDDEIMVAYGYMDGGQWISHREDGPAVTKYHQTCTSGWHINYCIKVFEVWHIHGYANRKSYGYTYKEWEDDGTPKLEIWHKDGVAHRLDGPAYIKWDHNGIVESEMWGINGQVVRTENIAGIDFKKWPLSKEEQVLLKLFSE